MEKGFDRCVDETANIPGVIGVVCADQQGLCLKSKGQITNSTPGLIAEISQIASRLEQGEAPVIALESDALNVYIKCVGEVTTAIFKTPIKN